MKKTRKRKTAQRKKPRLQPLDSFAFPRFTQPATFFRTPLRLGSTAVDIALVGVPFDFNTNRSGTRFAPAQVREMSRLIRRYNAVGDTSPFDLCEIADIGDAPVNPLNIDDSVGMIAGFFARLAKKGIAPISIGGDHGVSYPVWKGMAPKQPLAVVHFDSHPDTYHAFWGSLYNQGTLLKRGVEENLIDPKRVVSIGLRGTRFALDDRKFNLATGMRVITMDEYERLGRDKVIAEIRRVVGRHPTYVTFDIDGLDPAYCIGTGAPEPGGLMMRDVQVMLRSLHGLDIVGGDVCEVSPPLDPSGHTALNAANIMFEILCLTAAARKAGGPTKRKR